MNDSRTPQDISVKDEIFWACLSLFGLERRAANARQVFHSLPE